MANCIRCGARIAPNLDGTCDELCYDCKNSQDTKSGSNQNHDMSFQINDTQEYESHLNGGNQLYNSAPGTGVPAAQNADAMSALKKYALQQNNQLTQAILSKTPEYHFDKIKDRPLTAMPFPGSFSVTDVSSGPDKEYEIKINASRGAASEIGIGLVIVALMSLITFLVVNESSKSGDTVVLWVIVPIFVAAGLALMYQGISSIGKYHFLRFTDSGLVSFYGKQFNNFGTDFDSYSSGKYNSVSREQSVTVLMQLSMGGGGSTNGRSYSRSDNVRSYDFDSSATLVNILIDSGTNNFSVARNISGQDASFLYQFLVWYFTAKEPLV